MLAFNEDADAFEDEFSLPPAGSSHNQWKILIYDGPCRSIISPLLSVSQLRRRGVTLHLLLNSEREPIPDVPAIYFCCPTKENLAIIAKDCSRGLYGRCHLNFVTKLERGLMEDFAKLVVQTGSLESIAGVHDQYLDFVCLEQQLFSLAKKDSYVLYNGSGASEQMIEQSWPMASSVSWRPKARSPSSVAPRYNTILTRLTCISFLLSSHSHFLIFPSFRAALPKW
jgi:sec1 family domain-containing protein 1